MVRGDAFRQTEAWIIEMRGLAWRQIRRIAQDLYPICYDVDREIGGCSRKKAAAFARGNAIRHARTVQDLLEHAKRLGQESMRVVNASGMSVGHQDFSIVEYLRNRTAISVEWTVFESPLSPFLVHPRHREYADHLGIRIVLSDFFRSERLFGEVDGAYDVGIFTETAEHLDHSVLLQVLEDLSRILKPDGVLFLTTPNMVSLPNRLRVLFGNGDGPYFGDGQANREAGLYGHIALYDARRMGRLLCDAGFRVLRAETFNSYFLGSFRDDPLEWMAGKTLDLMVRLFSNGGGTLLILAGKGDPKPIPFAS